MLLEKHDLLRKLTHLLELVSEKETQDLDAVTFTDVLTSWVDLDSQNNKNWIHSSIEDLSHIIIKTSNKIINVVNFPSTFLFTIIRGNEYRINKLEDLELNLSFISNLNYVPLTLDFISDKEEKKVFVQIYPVSKSLSLDFSLNYNYPCIEEIFFKYEEDKRLYRINKEEINKIDFF